MRTSRRPSLIRRTVLTTGIGGALLIAALTLVTYELILRAIEERGLNSLEQYVTQRAKREEMRLEQIRDNLTIAARAFTERYQAPDPANYLDRFDEIFMQYPDGSYRNRPEHGDGMKETTMWANKDTEFTPEVRRRALIIYDVCEQLLPAWRKTFNSIYATSPDQMNIGFDSTIPNWVYDTEADRNQNLNETEVVASQAMNPSREMVWAGPMIEPTYGDYIVTLCQPVDIDGRHLASWCHDVPFANLVRESLRADIPGMTSMMFRRNGRLIAHAEKEDAIVAAKGQYNMRDDPVLARLAAAVVAHGDESLAGYDPEAKLYYAASHIAGPDWFFLSTLPRAALAGQAIRYSQWVLFTGLAAILVLLGFLFVTLQKSVAEPLRRLTRATDDLSAGSCDAAISVPRQDELGQLAASFNRMAQSVRDRDASLRQLNLDLERRIAERTSELQASEARMRTMLEHAPEAIVVLDAGTGRFVDGNEHALRLFEVDRAGLTQIGPIEASPSQQADGDRTDDLARQHIADALAGRSPVFEWLHRAQSGRLVACEIRLQRLPAKDRQLVIATITDISERKEAEASLLKALAHERELNEMKSSFVSLVSHEFRTPLGIISSSAEILARYLDRLPPEQRSTHLDTIVRSTRTLNRLIEEVLFLGRVESGRMAFVPQPIDLTVFTATLADEVISSTGNTSPISVVVEGETGGAVGDENILRHVLTNLLSNAVKYSPPGAPVSFHARRDGDFAVFTVSDRGIGIPADDMRKLFTAFHRGHNVGQRPGSGLGLTIVRRCVRLHGGEVDLQSEPDQGTIATVRVPMFNRVPASKLPVSENSAATP